MDGFGHGQEDASKYKHGITGGEAPAAPETLVARVAKIEAFLTLVQPGWNQPSFTVTPKESLPVEDAALQQGGVPADPGVPTDAVTAPAADPASAAADTASGETLGDA